MCAVLASGRVGAEGPKEECGVFGLYAPEAQREAAKLAYFALYAPQHRGPESAGIAIQATR